MNATIAPAIDATKPRLDALAYMAEEEESAELQAADKAYSLAMRELQRSAPEALQAAILRLEEAANWYCALTSESYFFGGLRLGLCGDRRRAGPA